MAKFGIGDKVIRIEDDVRGTVVNVMQAGRGGRQLYTVAFTSGEKNLLEVDLRADFKISDPFERCKMGVFETYSEYAKKNTTFKIRNSNNSTISSLKASKTLFRPYQFRPLLKFLNSPNRRLLVADEVGLGKTIEAGHIMLELKARRELKNVLIVCPKSLQEKWKAELYEKFGLIFKVIDNSKDLIADLSSHSESVRAIINYEKLRMAHMKNGKGEEYVVDKKKYTNLVEYLSENPQRFSLVLCDEAHKMRNRETQTYKGAEILMDCADAVLFLTATPIMLNEENLYNLLHLLDNTRYFNYQIFMNLMRENRPFVKAISQLKNKNCDISFREILDELINTEIETSFFADGNSIYYKRGSIGELYENDPVFCEIVELLNGEDSKGVRARLFYLLSTMSVMNTIFSRTRKRDVTTDMSQAERKPHIRKIDLFPEEQEEFNKIINFYNDDHSYNEYSGEEYLTPIGALGLVQKKRQIASSVWGYLNEEADLDRGIDKYRDYRDAKVEELVKIIQTVFKNGRRKIVIFALFRKTLKYLQIRLKSKGFNSIVIHGLIDNRAELLYHFKNDNNVQILLSSEVGSEGLDMQFCNSMVNYDLPWNPMVVEQRIGRIDRFGQESPIVNIYNMVVAGSIQETIYMRLLERIGIFHDNIGDIEAILDSQYDFNGKKMTIQDVYNRMEKELFTKELTQSELEKKISEVESAFEYEKENLKHLQEGLSNTLTNDAYFEEEIRRILHKNAYVTEFELKNYLLSVIRQELTTCEMEEVEGGIFEFRIPVSQPNILHKFLVQYSDNSNNDATISLGQFKHRIEDTLIFRLTFNQDIAYKDVTINYLNIYHPLIQACLNYFLENDDEAKTTFSYAISQDDVLHTGERYYMALYQLVNTRYVQGVKKKNVELLPVVYNIDNEQIEHDQDVVDALFRRSQIEGTERNARNADIKSGIIDYMNYDFAEYIRAEKIDRINEISKQIESEHLRNKQQTIEYYQSRIANHRQNIKSWEGYLEFISEGKEARGWRGAIQLAKSNISQLENELKDRLAQINDDEQHKLNIDEKLLSLNLITIL